NVRPGFQVLAVNGGNDMRLRNGKDVVVQPQVLWMVRELPAAIVRLAEVMRLDHGTHSTVNNQDALIQQRLNRLQTVISHENSMLLNLLWLDPQPIPPVLACLQITMTGIRTASAPETYVNPASLSA